MTTPIIGGLDLENGYLKANINAKTTKDALVRVRLSFIGFTWEKASNLYISDFTAR
ncbi:hypothetical protein G3A_02705 [Bacillus sp. 17376]|uniref:Uncharacterized protein n=1 Tax=Mesobacillus boroniphilus JCM 21738 TaxID=1294265 RepID=W4RVY6_9BACI|nr:hypothetical protein [Mesobacillus boroniphilus]ESU34127.1 hypothetical protein G3A_02705 [Bacillus sp. 17376]GAE48297.1 hypothetical protein JCM21738_5391 [Mesobacillus boroniphilus JCM 21738]